MSYHRGFCHDADALHFKIIALCALFCLSTFGPCTMTGTHNPIDYGENTNQIPPPKLSLENICRPSDVFCLPSTLSDFFSDFHSPEANLSGFPEVKEDETSLVGSMPPVNNLSWSSNHGNFQLLTGNVVSCSLELTENAQIDKNDIDTPFERKTKGVDQKEESFRIKANNVDDFSSPHVQISHHLLDWGQKHLHFPSLAFLTVENRHKDSVLNVFEPYSTNSQFYPCNHSGIKLKPGEIASICFVFLPKSLGSSSGHLILQTSSGGFLIQALGFAVESPYSIQPSFGGRLINVVSLFNPSEKVLHLKEVSFWISFSSGNVSYSVKGICSAIDHNGSTEFSPEEWLDVKISQFGQVGQPLVAIKPHKWTVGSNLDEPILEFEFYGSQENVFGSFCVQLLVETNKSDASELESCCCDVVSLSSRSQNEGADRVLPPLEIKATDMTKSDESVLGNRRSHWTKNKISVLEDNEVMFPIVHVNTHKSKWIKVINPSNQPVTIQLLLNSKEIINNCQTSDQILQPVSILNSHTTPSRYGFSISRNGLIEAYLHPHGKTFLGPIVFHPSSRCSWKSSALVKNNLSGVEWVSLRGSGGFTGLVLLNGSGTDPVRIVKLEHGGFGQRSVKVLFAKNTGDFPIKVEKITILGTKCELDGVVVGSCKGFGLLPGESRKIMVSYRADFCVGIVHRELQLVMSGGILVVPVEVGLSTPLLTVCKRSLLWARFKKFVLAIIVSVFIISMACSCSFSFSFVIPDGNSSTVTSGQVEQSSDVCPEPETVPIQTMCFPETAEEVAVAAVVEPSKPENLTDLKTGKNKARRRKKKRGSGSGSSSGLAGQFDGSSSHSSNSTPSSPLSPPVSLTPKRSTFARAKSPEKCSTVPPPPLPKDEPCAPATSPAPRVRAPGPERKDGEGSSGSEYNIWDDHLQLMPTIAEDNSFDSLFETSPQELFTAVSPKKD